MLRCLLTAVKALKGRINSAQYEAKRSVGEKGIAFRRRAVNSMVNCQWLIVMPDTMDDMATTVVITQEEMNRIPGSSPEDEKK